MSSEHDQANLSARLMEACSGLEKSLMAFKEINNKAHFIALSASIEGARMRSRLGTFAIVANQIAAQASKNSTLSEKLDSLILKIKAEALEAIAVRNYELASDLIDKLDRNLFERNCDVQAWATFDEVKEALASTSEETQLKASKTLERLTSIYVVYSESLLLDTVGNVVAAAHDKSLVGRELSARDWFKAALSGQVYVSDLHFSDFVQKRCVFYCSPVTDDNQQVIGVLCNAFNWDYALEMLKSADFNKHTRGTIINSQGAVIASGRESQILNDNSMWMSSGERALDQKCGFSTELARNGRPLAVGFAHTKGYNAYKGKGWSAIVSESLGDATIRVVSKVLEDRSHAQGTPVGANRSQIASEIISDKLMNTMKEIDDLVLEINSNNREVKLLAVNASIQAGLAGGDGEGFSIIANEVAILAKKSLTFVEEVNQITLSLRHAVEDCSSVRLVDAAKDTMSKVDRNLFERFCDIQAWSIFSRLVNVAESDQTGNADAAALLEKIHRIYEVYHDIYLLSADGRVLSAAVNRNLVGHNYAQKDWFKGAASGGIFVSDIYISDMLKMPVMTFSAPVYGSSGQVVGIIVSKFNCNFLNDIIRATIVDSTSWCFLLSHEGKVIGSARNEDIYNKAMAGLKIIKEGSHESHGLFESTNGENNQDKFFGFSFSKGYNTYRGQRWVTVTERPSRKTALMQQMDPAERFRKQVLEKLKKTA